MFDLLIWWAGSLLSVTLPKLFKLLAISLCDADSSILCDGREGVKNKRSMEFSILLVGCWV